MSDTQNNQNEEQTKTNPMNPPKLCTGCMQFFGNPNQQNLCSKCYESVIANQQKVENKSIKAQAIEIEEQKSKDIKQKDVNHCWKCNKKVGFFGYQCKCLYTFCKVHRLPENHDCEFDFKELASEKLKKLNPQLKHDKIEKI